MRKAKMLLLGAFGMVAASAGALALTSTPLAAAAPSYRCGNTYCNPGTTTCSYYWDKQCTLSGTPPHYCEGWSNCGAS
jgi:hypothetical protein